jgi:hypothetical protein
MINKTQGQIDYEANVARDPNYHTGEPRKTWGQLSDLCKWTWNKPKQNA